VLGGNKVEQNAESVKSTYSPNKLKHWVITIERNIKRRYWTFIVRRRVKSCGKNLHVNFKSKIGRNTYLGNNVSFNGMHIKGKGKVVIGDRLKIMFGWAIGSLYWAEVTLAKVRSYKREAL